MRLIRTRELRDKVLPAHLGRIHLESGRGGVDHALEDVAGLGTARAPVGIDGGGVGEDPCHLALDGAHDVDTVQERAVQEGRHRGPKGREVGAQVRGGLDVEAQDLAVLGHCHRRLCDVVAPVGVREVRLAPGRRPPHGPLDLARRPRADHLFVVEEDLGAEAAAHVGSDHPHLVLRDAEDERAHEKAVHVGVLGRDPECQVAAGVLVARDAGPRLHCVGNETLVHDALLHHDVGALEGRVHVAAPEFPLEGDVPWGAGVNLRGALLARAIGHRHRRQRLPLNGDQLRRVEGGVLAVRDDHRDGVSHVAGHIGAQGHVRDHGEVLHHPGDVLVLAEIPSARQRVDPGHVLAREDRHDARVLEGFRRVDLPDLRVRVRAPDEGRVGHARQLQVVHVVALAGHEARILAPLDAGAHQFCGGHDRLPTSPPSSRRRAGWP